MRRIVTVIDDAIRSKKVACLPCERVNLDYERFSEYRDSDEHKASGVFENPRPTGSRVTTDQLPPDVPSILRFFLDGSRRTYKVADLLVNGRYLPLIAGQVGVAVIRRNGRRLEPLREIGCWENVVAFPDEVTSPADLKALSERIRKETGFDFTLVRYTVKDRDPVDLGVAKIMSHMAGRELTAVHQLSEGHCLQSNSLLVKDGPLRYKNIKGRGFDVTQFRNVIGVSKTFRPSFAVGKGQWKKDVGAVTASLEMGERTPVFKTLEEDKCIGMWYLRIRPRDRMYSPLQGIVKIECYAIEREEEEKGLCSERVNTISAHLLNERNVTSYGSDTRWATHLYPIYQTEMFIKSNLLSDIRFKALF